MRDHVCVSTAVAEEALHLCPVRDMSTKTFTDKWELVDIDCQARMIAHTSHHLLTSKGVKKIEIDEEAGTEELESEEYATSTKDPFLAVTVPHASPSEAVSPDISSKSLLSSTSSDLDLAPSELLPNNTRSPWVPIQQNRQNRFSKIVSVIFHCIKKLFRNAPEVLSST